MGIPTLIRTMNKQPLPAQAKAREMAAFKQRLATLQPEIAKAIGSETPQGEEIKKRAAEMAALASKAKALTPGKSWMMSRRS